jgi:hypothetical protein
MAALNMGHCLPLNIETIRINVKKKIGNYALGYYVENPNTNGFRFITHYVGRSDNDLQAEIIQQGIRLKKNENGTPIFSHFKFIYTTTAKKAYLKECKDFHAFGGSEGLHNQRHPKRPSGFTNETLHCSKLSCLD